MNAFNYLSGRDSFSRIREHTVGLLLHYGHKVPLQTWQGVDVSNRPEMAMTELMNYTFTHILDGKASLETLAQDIKPNLPWADDHFEERVCGYPLNPGVEWQNWPWGDSADSFRESTGLFNHNYMERYWPRQAGYITNEVGDAEDYQACIPDHPDFGIPIHGIRNAYGDLSDIPKTLVQNPTTNQAYLPIFIPKTSER